MYMGEGGTIPFMYMLGEKFPKAQFCITGVLGPGSNAHGPNEFLHIPTARKLTLCVADVLATHAQQLIDVSSLTATALELDGLSIRDCTRRDLEPAFDTASSRAGRCNFCQVVSSRGVSVPET